MSWCVGRLAPTFPDMETLMTKLRASDASEYGAILSSALGKQITFTALDKNVQLGNLGSPRTHWDILEYLSQNGELKINGRGMEEWQKIRNVFAAEPGFCNKNVSVGTLLNELTFFTGRRFTVAAGNADAKLNFELKGLSLAEILAALESANQIVVNER